MARLDCLHNGSFINIPGVPQHEGGACGRCGLEIRANYLQLLRIAAAAVDYKEDSENTISSVEGVRTRNVRMERRMQLRKRLFDSLTPTQDQTK